jgi:methionyl-tRNA formyltransferase
MMGSMLDESIHDTLKNWKPDCLLVVGWYHMIPPSILELAPAFGLHASLLPDYSGGAPLVWAIINGEKTTGITLFRMDTGVDNGPIVASRESDILGSDTIATLYNRIEVLGLELLSVHLEEMAAGTVATHSQDESARRVFPQRSPADGRLDWKSSSEVLYNFVRAQTRPYPGAFTYCRGEKITIWNAESSGGSREVGVQIGRIVLGSCGTIFAGCGRDELLALLTLEFRGIEYDARAWYDLVMSEDNSTLVCG